MKHFSCYQNNNKKYNIDILIKSFNPNYTSFFLESIKIYNERKNTFFHTIEHISFILIKLLNYKKIHFQKHQLNILALVAFYHDSIYDVKNKNGLNEKLSAELFEKDFETYFKVCFPEKTFIQKEVFEIINLTSIKPDFSIKYSKKVEDKDLSNIFNLLDYSIFLDSENIFNYEEQIFKEYQQYSLLEYVKNRLIFLKDFKSELEKITNFKNTFYDKNEINIMKNNIDLLINYIKNRNYKIGIYPGSFNPFHKGHLNVLEQAEENFNKIIIFRAINLEKSSNKNILNKERIDFREIVEYSGMTHTYIEDLEKLFKDENLNVSISLIRGLRNGFDLQHEQNMRRFLKDFNDRIKIVYYFCEPQFEHISSSAIRNLSDDLKQMYL